jgi:hypothetical protein
VTEPNEGARSQKEADLSASAIGEASPKAATQDQAPAPHSRSFKPKRPKSAEEAKALIDKMSNSGERFAEVDS